MKKDYYELLGINKGATSDEIKRAYRKMAKQHHPDMNPDNKKESEEKFKEISEAYEVLMDPQKKQMYDQYGHDGVSQTFRGGGFDWRDFHHFDDLQDIFGNLGVFYRSAYIREKHLHYAVFFEEPEGLAGMTAP